MNRLLKLINRVLSRIIVALIVLALIFSSYGLWSNHLVYAQTEDVYSQLLQFKPVSDGEAAQELDFSQLREINPDVCGWITIPNTHIDYPIVQGENNLVYLNRNVYGAFSLAGSIYMDTRNSSDLRDSYTLIYGHHMSSGLMFGDLDLFKDKEFFEANHSATVVTEGNILDMKVLAVLEVQDDTAEIFSPTLWGKDLSGLAAYVEKNAMHIWNPALQELKENPTTTQAVALVTCTDGATGNRTVVILTARRPANSPTNPDKPGGNTQTPTSPGTSQPPKTGDSLYNSPALWFSTLAASAFMMLMILRCLLRRS